MKRSSFAGQPGFAKAVLLGFGVSCAVSVVLISITTAMILKEALSIEQLSYICPCIHFIVLFAGCMCSGTAAKQNKLFSSAAIFVLTYFVCIGTTVLMFDGKFSGIITNPLTGLLGAAAAFAVNHRRGRKSKIKFRKAKIC